MAHLTPADAVLLIVLVIIMPGYSYYNGTRIAGGTMPDRSVSYARTIASWWLIALAMLFAWLRFGRPASALGFTVEPDTRALCGIILCVLALALFAAQESIVSRLSPEKLAALGGRLGATAAILPRTPLEYRWFIAVAITVGVCEELLYRGYLYAVAIPYATTFGAILGSGLVFGLGHLYQGAAGVFKTSAVGIILGIVYVATGSLLWPILLHVLIDIAGGTVGYRLLRSQDAPELV